MSEIAKFIWIGIPHCNLPEDHMTNDKSCAALPSSRTRRVALLAVLACLLLTGAVQTKEFVGSLQTSKGEWLAEKEGRVVLVRGSNNSVQKTEGLEPVWGISSPYLQTRTGKFLAIDQRESGAIVLLAEEKSDAAKWVIEVTETSSPQHPKGGSRSEKQMLVGTASSKFRLSVFAGRYKGWYLSAAEAGEKLSTVKVPSDMNSGDKASGEDKPGNEKQGNEKPGTTKPSEEKPANDAKERSGTQRSNASTEDVVVRHFKVVQDVKQALSFEYIDTRYKINHK